MMSWGICGWSTVVVANLLIVAPLALLLASLLALLLFLSFALLASDLDFIIPIKRIIGGWIGINIGKESGRTTVVFAFHDDDVALSLGMNAMAAEQECDEEKKIHDISMSNL